MFTSSTRFPKQAGLSCDESPFASTEEGQGTKGNHKAVTRCVPAKENSRQGGKISGVYRGLANGKAFDVRFDFGKGAIAAGDAGGQGYCAPAAQRNCNNLANDLYQEDD
ncbi:hypothetical protein DAEQUDRAFT_812025 [Daedalea quercina L-15889]|uniref:Deoxyribonuclease NucA/NucB domain-containing protein n=1 Tax=Daedalea quercina L-15889 TaxID=1314783 RepID=A0A165PTB7_9APHY|nr:hypothetical protein DAEQUDRAFT_812025 [Daedalea quercina L-15889]